MLDKLAWRNSAQHAANNEPVIDLVEAIRILQRQWFLVACVLMLTLGVAVAYLIVTPPRYTATAMLLFEFNANNPGAPSRSSAAESTYVDSQVEVLKSEEIARTVITKLHLESDPDLRPEKSFLSSIRHQLKELVIGDGNDGEADPMVALAKFLQSNLTVKRVGLTNVVEISYQSLDRERAARISNAMATTYIAAQLESNVSAADQVGAWLQSRIKKLRTQAQSAEKAVAEFKTQKDVDRTRSLSDSELAMLSNQRNAALRDLESTAQAYRTLYEAFVQRVIQSQPFPRPDSRVASKATPPINKSAPKTLLVLATAILLGAVGGAGAAFLREHLRAVFVSPSQIEKELGIGCLGILPVLQNPRLKPSAPADGQITNDIPVSTGPRKMSRDRQGYTRSVDDPFSLWSEAFRFLAIDTISLRRPATVIGVTSALAGEGKSIVAANLAELLADGGRKVLLADCNLRNSDLTQRLAPRATKGLLNAIQESAVCLENQNSVVDPARDRDSQYNAAFKQLFPASAQAQTGQPQPLEPGGNKGLDVTRESQGRLEEFVWTDPVTGLDFLPAPLPLVQTAHPSTALSSSQMQRLLASAHNAYDHVILDLPALLAVADVKAVSQLIGAFILVIEWDRTSRSTVRDALNTAPPLADKLLGAVLNKADPSVLERLESYSG